MPSQTATSLRQVLAESDLPNPRKSGAWIRSACPIHGSDHQRSLSIRDDESEYRGFGDCKACGAQVLIREMNPEAAARFESGRAGAGRDRSPEQYRQQLARAQLAPRSAAQPEPQEWQRDEMAALRRFAGRMAECLSGERPAAYLAERGIPLDIAQACGVGYIPADARLAGTGLAAKWRDRLVFPLASPAGAGFIGRSLHDWQPGMDETAHKGILDAKDRAAEDVRAWGRRWEKTMPAGWYGFAGMASHEQIVMVEGAFDALALIAAGLAGGQVIALAGTAASEEWIPGTVRGVVIALDGDETGQAKALDLAARLAHAYPWPKVGICTPPADGVGKDWSERWRRAQWDGVAPVLDACDALESLDAREDLRAEIRADAPLMPALPDVLPDARISASETIAAADVMPAAGDTLAAAAMLSDLEAEARADDIVRELLDMGYVLADVRAIPEGEDFAPAVLDMPGYQENILAVLAYYGGSMRRLDLIRALGFSSAPGKVQGDLDALARAEWIRFANDVYSLPPDARKVRAQARASASSSASAVLRWPTMDAPPAEPHTCGQRLWAHRRDGNGWACIVCEWSLVIAGQVHHG